MSIAYSRLLCGEWVIGHLRRHQCGGIEERRFACVCLANQPYLDHDFSHYYYCLYTLLSVRGDRQLQGTLLEIETLQAAIGR
jgi:hypothetical protein